MANYADLKALVAAYVKQNGTGAISGVGLQTQLFNMINSLGAGYQCAGIATPSTNPGTPDQNVFYIASEPGTYTNFSSLVVGDNEVAILKYNGSWAKQTTGAATAGTVSQLGQEVIGKIDSFKRGLSLTQGQAVDLEGSVLPVFVNNGEDFIVKIIGDSSKLSKVTALYICNSAGGEGIAIRNNAPLNTDLEFTANQAIRYLALYIDGSLVLSDQDISFECYTSINLSVKELQRQINETNEELHSLVPGVTDEATKDSNNLITSGGAYQELRNTVGNFDRTYSLTAGQDVYLNASVFPAKIKSGEKFSLLIKGDATKIGKVAGVYACNSVGADSVLLQLNLVPNQLYDLTANIDIDYLAIYVEGNRVYSNTDITLICATGLTYNSNGVSELQEIIGEIEPIVDELNDAINGFQIEKTFSGSYDSSGNFSTPLPSTFSVNAGDDVILELSDLVNINNNTYVYLMHGSTALSAGVRAAANMTITANSSGVVNAIKFYNPSGANLAVGGTIIIPISDGLLADYKKYNVIGDKYVQGLTTAQSVQDFMFDTPFTDVDENDRFVLDLQTLEHPVWAYLIYSADKTSSQVYHNYIVVPGKYVFEGFLGNTIFGIKLYCPSFSTMDVAFTLTRLNVKQRTQYEIDNLAGDVVPVYYRRPATLADNTQVSDYLWEKRKTVENAISAAMPNGDAFVFITDIHSDNGQNQMKSPMLIKYLQEHCNIPRLFNCGDDGGGPVIAVNQLLRRAMGGDRVYTIAGNHDYMLQASYGDVFYAQNMFAKDAVFGSDDKNYFYVDNQQQKIRYIILSTYGTDNGSVIEIMGSDHFDEDQMLWFTSTALNAPEGYSIIVFAHHIFGIINSSEVVNLGTGEARYVDAIVSHNANNDEKVIAVFDGHAHRDRIINLSSDPTVYQSGTRDNTTVPCIITTCDKNVPYLGIDNDMNITDRGAGTIREQAFDVVVVDKTNKTIKCVRIGCEALDGIGGSSDRTAEQNSGVPVEIREVTYPI